MTAEPTDRLLDLEPSAPYHSINSNGHVNRPDPDHLSILRACTLFEDGHKYRSIYHRVDNSSLVYYRLYYSYFARFFSHLVLTILLLLPFLEHPSSLRLSSDPHIAKEPFEFAYGVIGSVEFICLLFLLADRALKVYFQGMSRLPRDKWLMIGLLLILLSLIDCMVSAFTLGSYKIRLRRYVRPFFLIQQSSLMKKAVKCVRSTLPQIVSVLILLFVHIYFFSIFGMLLFTTRETHNNTLTDNLIQKSEQEEYFSSLLQSFLSLLVLLTTANNPDVMMPSYRYNRFAALYFIVFLMIGLYCLMNMLTAIVYNQFRGYLKESMQGSLHRRRVATLAAHRVLQVSDITVGSDCCAPIRLLYEAVELSRISGTFRTAVLQSLSCHESEYLHRDEWQQLMQSLDNVPSKEPPPAMETASPKFCWLQNLITHNYFTYFGCAISLLNVILITSELVIEREKVRHLKDTKLSIFNFTFVCYYAAEQILKIWAFSWPLYSFYGRNIFDGVTTVFLVIIEAINLSINGSSLAPIRNDVVSWDLVRTVNLLIMLRLLRVITHIPSMYVVVASLRDVIRNLKSFAGILLVIYYSYALLGMQLFHGAVPLQGRNHSSFSCGSYEQLNYWANNFDDFAAALVVLWDVMVVNNWHVFLAAYEHYVSKWSVLYFIVWWLLSVILCLNLITAMILENFILRWDLSMTSSSSTFRNFTVHDMFRSQLEEPDIEDLIAELDQHPFLRKL